MRNYVFLTALHGSIPLEVLVDADEYDGSPENYFIPAAEDARYEGEVGITGPLIDELPTIFNGEP